MASVRVALPLLLLCGLLSGCERPPVATPAEVVAILEAPLPEAALTARVQRGEELFYASRCSNCHVLKGPTRGAPRLSRLYDGPARLVGGETQARDRAYLARSILSAQDHVVEGYSQKMSSIYRIMPAENVAALIAFLETLSPRPAEPAVSDRQESSTGAEASVRPARWSAPDAE